jgi:hypothetical protein
MAENSDQGGKAAPSLMARTSGEAEEDGSGTRILAGLQGRLPVRTASTRKVSHTKRYILILVVLLLFVGGGLITFVMSGNEKSTPPITIAASSEKLRTDTKTEMNGHGSVATGNRLNASAEAPATTATIVDAPAPARPSDNAAKPPSTSPLSVALASHASEPSSNDSSGVGHASSDTGHAGSETNVSGNASDVGGKVSDPIGEIISANNTDSAVGDANATGAAASHTGPAGSVASGAAASAAMTPSHAAGNASVAARAAHGDRDTRLVSLASLGGSESVSGSESHSTATSHSASQTPAKTAAKANGKTGAKTGAKTKHARARNDTDVALLTALLSQGLPSPTSAHGKSAPKMIATVQVLPGSSLSERLKACHQLSWLSGERCRLDVCSGHWGIAPECPSAQPQTEQ